MHGFRVEAQDLKALNQAMRFSQTASLIRALHPQGGYGSYGYGGYDGYASYGQVR